MEKELIEGAMSDSELLKNMINIATNDDFFAIKGEPKRKLAECLEGLSDNAIDMIYSIYQTVIMPKKNLKDITDRKEKEKTLNSIIKESFKEFINDGFSYDDIKAIEKMLASQDFKEDMFNYLIDGFAYQYKKGNKYKIVMPDELVAIYEEYRQNGKMTEKLHDEAYKFFTTYLLINGVVRKDVMKDILVNHHGFKLTDEQIEALSSESFSIEDHYCICEGESLDETLKFKDEEHYLKFSEKEIDDYCKFIGLFIKELTDALSKKHRDENILLLLFILSTEIYKDDFTEFGLSKKEANAINDIIDKYQDTIKYWYYDGRTVVEENLVDMAEDVAFKEKPTSFTIDGCLANIDELLYEDTLSKEEVLNNLDELLCEYGKVDELININSKSVYEIKASLDYFSKGLLFFYRVEDDIKCLVPDDIIEIINNRNDIKEDKYGDLLVSAYLETNCVLRKEKLQQLLKNHELDYDIKELDKLVIDNDYHILNDSYYSIFEEFDENELDDMLKTKDKFSKYKTADLIKYQRELEFFNELWAVIYIDIPTSDFNKEEYFDVLRQFARESFFTKSSIEDFAKISGFKLSSKTRDKIMKLYNEYKDSISVWTYNGYTVVEYNNMKKETKKVGRNDPCSCGSGLKYKKCCGK